MISKKSSQCYYSNTSLEITPEKSIPQLLREVELHQSK